MVKWIVVLCTRREASNHLAVAMSVTAKLFGVTAQLILTWRDCSAHFKSSSSHGN